MAELKDRIKNSELRTKESNADNRLNSQFSILNSIRFGTDGWRGIIAEDFTYENVRIVSQAIADYVRKMEDGRLKMEAQKPLPASRFPLPAVVVGYDNRFLSEKFAVEVAKVISANGIDVCVSQTAVTSPSISQYCQKNKCLGIMITASHNPPIWNGLKIKLAYGGSATEDVVNKISSNLYKNNVRIGTEKIKTADVLKDYKKYLRTFLKSNSSIKSKIIVDSMCGSGAGIFEQVYKGRVYAINNRRDPLFPDFNPEPIEKNLYKLKREVLKNSASAGFAFDGDADRLGVIDDNGRYLSPHIVFPLILRYLLEYKKLKGKIVQTVSLGYLSERIAEKFSLEFEEVPVGFKYICEKMLNENILLGGEESGGYGWKGGLPERDGILNALLIAEMLINSKKKLSFLVDDLQKKFGRSYFIRKDIKLAKPVDQKEFVKDIEKKIRGNPRQFAFAVKEIRTSDGIKIIFNLPGDGWFLLRPSGTEPVLRTYAETDSMSKTKKLLAFAEEICFNLLNNADRR